MQVQSPPAVVAVRNLKPGPTVFADTSSDVNIRWEGRGDPAGQDVQLVPSALLSQAQFVSSMNRGVFEVVDETTPIAPVADGAGQDLINQAAAAIHRPEVNDIVVQACLGPGSRAGASCETPVNTRQSDLATAPPLCDAHSHLGDQFTMDGESWTQAPPSVQSVSAVQE